MTKIWITRPYDVDGIEEVELIEASQSFVRYETPGLQHCDSGVAEGKYWHRTKAAAILEARRLRAEWILKTKAEAERVAMLPFPLESAVPNGARGAGS